MIFNQRNSCRFAAPNVCVFHCVACVFWIGALTRFLESVVVEHEAIPDDNILVIANGGDSEGGGDDWP